VVVVAVFVVVEVAVFVATDAVEANDLDNGLEMQMCLTLHLPY
jgi:hypothetical protein